MAIAEARTDNIGEAFRRSVRKRAAAPAIAYDGRSWTYDELSRGAERVASYLIATGLQKGDRLAAFGRNSDAYVLLWLGCVRSGIVHVPINYALTPPELAYILQQCGASALVFDADLEPVVAQVDPRHPVRTTGHFWGGAGAFDVLEIALRGERSGSLVEPAAEDLAQLLYTSGTTAAPKGAMMTHAALLAEYVSCIVETGQASTDRWLAALPLYHSAQMHCFLMPSLLLGASTILIAAPAPAECLRLIGEHRLTSFFAPPTVWISLLRHPDFAARDLSSLRNVYYGASIMPAPVLAELRERLPQAGTFNLYGQSEIGPLATVLRPEEHLQRPSSAGRPVFNVSTRIVDPEMKDAPTGTPGEIVHRSPQLMVGYWDKPHETDEAFADGWFHSGDVGWRDEEGFIYVTDRMKDVINTGGIVVSSREVEDVLFTHPSVFEAAVIALPDPKWVEAVVAVVVLREDQPAEELALLAHARAALAPYKVPKRIFFTDALPRNTAGKILKRTLRERYETQP